MDEKEEGEISLDDISDISSEDGIAFRHPSSWDSSRRSRSHTKRDSSHGKENRRHERDAAATATATAVQPVKYTMPTLHEKNEDLLLISSDEDLEIVCVPGSSRQVVVQSFKKKRKKKKKKKSGNGGGGDFNFSINDFVSVNEDENERIVNHTEAQKILSRRRRTPSPVHKRKRSPPISRTNDYHKSSSYHRSSTRYSRSPSPKRKSPKRHKSPKKPSPTPVPPPTLPSIIQPSTTGTHENINYHKKKDITSNHTPKEGNYDEHYASTLLKKVKHLDAVGSISPKKTNKQKGAPSLKDKLNNMLKVQTEVFEIPESKLLDVIIKEEPQVEQEVLESVDSELQNINDTDKTTVTTTNVIATENIQQENNNNNNNNNRNSIDDNDEEDLKLRMIALRSAVMNKHQNRVKKGAAKKSKSQKREGSPFSDSFFDHDNINDNVDVVFDSMPAGHTQTTNTQQVEDMDIDSDLEREKIDIYSPSYSSTYSPTYSPAYSPPYSPTDDVIPIISIDPNIDEYNTSLSTPKSLMNSSQYNTPSDTINKTNKKKLSFTEELIKNSDNCDDDNTDVPYSPTDSAIPYEEMITPPKKLITPMQPPPPIPSALNFSNISNYSYHQNNTISMPLEQDPVELIPPEILREMSSSPTDFPVIIDEVINNHNEQKHTSIKSNIDKQFINSCDSFLTNNSQDNNCVDEPLYLQGVPDITKDINKIPTSIDKSLVPMTILKTNKNLQQPLLIKKLEQMPEPTFKSAEMQIVNVVSEKNSQTNAIFKPIKLQPVVKKTTFNSTSARAFDSYLNDDISIDDFPIEDLTAHSYNDAKVIITNESKIVDANFRVTENNYNSTKNNEKSIVNTLDNDNNIEAIVVKDKQKNLLIKNENIVYKDKQENLKISEEKLREKLEFKKRRRLSKSELQVDDDLNCKKDSVSVEVIENQQNDNDDDDESNKDKRRRSSIEDDEEELRALLLASLSKRPKVIENIAPIKLPDAPQIIDDESIKKSTTLVENSLKNTTVNTKIVSPPANLTAVSNIAVKTVDKSVVPSAVAVPVVTEIKKSINPIGNLAKTNVKKVILPTVPTKTINNNLKKITTTAIATQKNANSTISTMRNKIINHVRLNENIRSTSPKLLSSSIKNCRLVINLGEDTDSDTDSECSNKSKNTDKTVVNLPKDDLTIPTTDFEKSVEAFLRDQRKKIESFNPIEQRDAFKKLSTSKVSTGKNLTGLASTPLAVRHLSASRQEEYRRLKQQILDRETIKLQRSLKNLGDKISNNIGTATITSPLSPASPAKTVNNNQIGEIKTVINSDEKSSQVNVINNTEKLPINEVSNVDKDNAQVINKTGEDNALCSFEKAPLELMPSPVEIIDDNSSTGQMSMEINKPAAPKLSFLKILTIEQLNKKFDDKARLEKINQVPNNDKSNENEENKLTIDQSINSEVKTCGVNTSSTIKTSTNVTLTKPHLISKKIEKIVEIPKKVHPIVETTKKITPIVETPKIVTPIVETTKIVDPIVETPTPAVILPSIESNQEKNNTNVDKTITLDDTHDENIQITNKITETVIQLPVEKLLNKQKKNKSPAKELSDKIKSDVKLELENLKDLSEDLKKEKLSLIEKDLIKNRNLVLNDLSELSENLTQWDIERELQTELTVEVRNLRMQLRLAEERLQEQRKKITKMGPKVAKAHKTIINGRTKCLKLTKLCQGIGSSVIGPRYKVPTTGAQRMVDGLKEVVFHTRQLSKKTTPTNISNKDDEDDENNDEIIRNKNIKCTEDVCDDDDDGLTDDVIEAVEIIKNDSTVIEDNYRPTCSSTPRSVELKKNDLSVDKKKSETERVVSKPIISSTRGNFDPNGVLCPYELMGTCSDDGCSYNHLDKNRGQ